VLSSDDQAWIRREQIDVPKFWLGHDSPPLVGDVLRFGGRQFVVYTRVWEHDSQAPVLRLFIGHARAQSDTSLGGL
jgi:hypothetical protein